MNQIMATFIGGLLAVTGGVIAAVYTQRRTHRRQREENFFHALGWLTGGSQERNVGVAVMEWYWKDEEFRKDDRLMDLSVTLLSNSAMYLLEESKQGDATHEKDNLSRIMDLLISVEPKTGKYGSRFVKLRTSVSKTLERRRREESRPRMETASHSKKELLKVDIDDLDGWLKRLA